MRFIVRSGRVHWTVLNVEPCRNGTVPVRFLLTKNNGNLRAGSTYECFGYYKSLAANPNLCIMNIKETSVIGDANIRMNSYDIIVVGGGPAGLAAAESARNVGLKVFLFLSGIKNLEVF